MQVTAVSDTVHKITFNDGRQLTLVGTAHVSAESVGEVERIIDEVKPDRICIELDKGRFDSKTKEKDYSSMDLKKIFKEGKAFLLLANTALASFQKRIGANTGVNPGDEILGAARIAEERGIPFSLCDREIQITLKRAWKLSKFGKKIKLLSALLDSAFSKEEISAEELEELKKTDTLQSMLNELAAELPGAKTALIDERDRFLATSIYVAEGNNKVAVIGAGHAQGLIKCLEKLESKELTTDLSDISSVPPKSKLSGLGQYVIPALVVGVVLYAIFAKGWHDGLKLFLLWIIANSGCTFIAAILSGAHPLNWIVSAVMAPIAALNPVIGVGMFAGLAEAKLRQPRVEDFERLTDDAGKFKGWFKNRFLHALVLFFTTSFGSIIGTFVIYPILIAAF